MKYPWAMQRMKLHTQGIPVQPLGSVHDIISRQYLTKEAELEAKRAEFSMLTLLTNPRISDDANWRSWKGTVNKVWSQYVGMLFNVEVESENDKDKALIKYYEEVVKPTNLKMYKDEATGGLRLLGAENLLM